MSYSLTNQCVNGISFNSFVITIQLIFTNTFYLVLIYFLLCLLVYILLNVRSAKNGVFPKVDHSGTDVIIISCVQSSCLLAN